MSSTIQTVLLSEIEDFASPPPTKGFVASLHEHGQVVPIILAKNDDGGYRVIVGRRRIVGAAHAGQISIEAVVNSESDPEREATILLLENLQRSHNPAAEARALAVLMESGCEEKKLADQFGISKATVSQRLKLLTLVPELFTKVETGTMSARAGWVAADLPEDLQCELAAQEKVRISQVVALRKAQDLQLLDLDSIETPQPRSDVDRAGLAAQLSSIAMQHTGNDRQVLLDASAILMRQPQTESAAADAEPWIESAETEYKTPAQVTAPFTEDQVASLNAFQTSHVMHPFTCADGGGQHGVLKAQEDGWHCKECDYTQDWAHAWMADWSWKQIPRLSPSSEPPTDQCVTARGHKRHILPTKDTPSLCGLGTRREPRLRPRTKTEDREICENCLRMERELAGGAQMDAEPPQGDEIELLPLASYIRDHDLIIRDEQHRQPGVDHKAVRVKDARPTAGTISTALGPVSLDALAKYRLVLCEGTVSIGDILVVATDDAKRPWTVRETTKSGASVVDWLGGSIFIEWAEVDADFRMLKRSQAPPLPETPEDLDPPVTVYLDATDVKPLFVAAGIGGDSWGTFRRRASGSLKRVCSKDLPMVDSRAEAQRHLDKWAKKRKLAVAPEGTVG